MSNRSGSNSKSRSSSSNSSGRRSNSSKPKSGGSKSRSNASESRSSRSSSSDYRSNSSRPKSGGARSRSNTSDRRSGGSESNTSSTSRRPGSTTGRPIGSRSRSDSEGGSRSRSGGKSFGSRSGGRGGFGSRGSSSRSGSGRGFGRSGGGRGRREVKKFDPSMFIKKVEEKTVTPPYIPKNTFNDFDIDKKVKKNIEIKGYQTPTPIQDEAIPLLIQGKDMIATANTGTGKTAAFLIPLVSKVLQNKGERVLIIAPTRELADQIQAELRTFKAKTGLTSSLCIGGASIGYQIRQLRKRPEFVIGTPGRLMDLERNGQINFKNYSSIVLDEVDTMLDMGFINDIKEIVGKLPAKRQSLFFSATIPPKLKSVMDEFLNNPATVSVKTRQSAENVNQDIVKVGGQDKVELLHDLLNKPSMKKVIIFSRTKRHADKLSGILKDRGFKVATIHGDKSQAQRKRSLEALKQGKVKILLATDVVARGIDISDITHVINYDMPQSYEDYIHRIGRTGRANKIGQAITFID